MRLSKHAFFLVAFAVSIILLIGAGPTKTRPMTLDELRASVIAMQAKITELEDRVKQLEGGAGNSVNPTTQPARPAANNLPGGLSQANDATVATLKSQKLLKAGDPGIQKMKLALLKQDAAIRKYVGDHDLSEKIKEAALNGAPTPGMPEELLLMIGTFEKPLLTETVDAKKGFWFRYGNSFETWTITIIGGKVYQQSEDAGEQGHWRTVLPQ